MPFHFGILSSTMHNAWMRQVGGRLESRYRYSKDIVYNNFPWPDKPSDEQRKDIEVAAQGVLIARQTAMKGDSDATLAVLYNPETMPAALVKAHQILDRAVDAAYVLDGGKRKWAGDAERVAFLFRRYREITSLLPEASST